MDPVRDITAQAREILKQSTLADSRPPGRKTWHRFQIAFNAAITVFSMAVFFYGLIVDVPSIGRCGPKKPKILSNGLFGSLPTNPQQFRLDSVMLSLNEM